MRPRRISALAGLLVFGLALLYGLVVVALLVHTPAGIEKWFRPKPRKPFSTVAWQASRFGDPDRYKMANDLVRSRRLVGRTEQAVRDLLGPESSQDQIGARTLIGYDLVPQRQFPARCFLLPSFLFLNTDTWLLEVELDHGTVTRVTIRFT
jgi:hypothetical protein